MFEQKQCVGLHARQNRALCLLLQVEPRAVFNASQSFDF
jgi:hypothetical protein